MYDNQIKDKFVELRAQGKSFGDISQELGVVKSTLHRWEDERADDIARLRRIQWEETEKSLGRRLEDQLEGLACDLLDYEQTLGNFNLGKLSVRETLMILRETRRAYFQTRALLMGNPPRRHKSAASAPSVVEPTKSNETERFQKNGTTRHRNTNDLQQPESQSFDSPEQSKIENPNSKMEAPHAAASSAENSNNASSVPPLMTSSEHPASPKSNETERFEENVTTESRNINDLQQPDSQSFDSPEQSKIENPKSKMDAPSQSAIVAPAARPADANHHSPLDDDFLGSLVINPHECGAGIVAKWLEHEAAHRRASPARD